MTSITTNIEGVNDNRPIFLMQATDDDGNVITFDDGTRAEFIPTVVPKITHENSGNIDTITDNCGRTEVNKNGNGNWDVVVESDYGLRQEMRQLMLFENIDQTPRVITDLYVGEAEIQDIQIIQQTSQNIGVILDQPTQIKDPEVYDIVGKKWVEDEGGGGKTNYIYELEDGSEVVGEGVGLPDDVTGGSGFEEQREERIYTYNLQLKQPNSENGGVQ
jgi:hypothetical protein